MKNPTKAQVQVVIDNLSKVLPYAQTEENLNMSAGNIPIKVNPCGTILCHAGWYAVAKLMNKDTNEVDIKNPEGENCVIDYTHGAAMIAEDLGMGKRYEGVGEYANANSDMWYGKGNRKQTTEIGNTIYPFSNKYAFYHPTKRPEGAKTLADIIMHWKNVQERLPE